MIVRTLDGDRELRASWPDYTVPPRPSIAPAAAGEAVTPARATGLPAFGSAVRKIAGVIAASKLDVYSGEGAKKRERPDAWQAKLFDQPSLELSRFDWLWDIASSLEVHENAVLQKIKNGSRVVELRPLPMDYVAIYRDKKSNEKVVEVNDGTRWRKMPPSEVLHIRGQTIGHGVAGVSKIQQHRDPLGSMLAAQRFEGAYFRNHARPDVALLFPEGVTREAASEWREYWQAEYGGAQNFGKAVPLGGGATVQPIPINMQDAQFIEARQLSVEDVARIMDVHALLLDHAGQRLQGDALRAALDIFMHLQMPYRVKRITDALKADPDLFGRTILYPEICIDELSFLDPLTRAQVEHQRVQDGTQLVDEVRASHGWAPLPPIPENPEQTPGMVPQLTPVGGQANPNTPAANEGDPQENMLVQPHIEVRTDIDTGPIAAELEPLVTQLVSIARESAVNNERAQKLIQEIETRRVKLDEARERRELDQHDRQADLVGAIRALPAPEVTVNVEPTPVTIENTVNVNPTPVTVAAPEVTVNVPQVPVQLTLDDNDDPGEMTVAFQRDPQGRIKSATITED